MQGFLVVGAHVVVYVNGRPYARVSGFSWGVDSPVKEVRGCDSPLAFELAPTTLRVNFTLNVFRTILDGGAEGVGMAPPPADLANQRYSSMALVDRRSDSILFRTDDGMCTQQQWNAPANGLVTGTISFQAISFSNEVTPVHG